MNPDRWQQIDELFDAALRLDPSERRALALRQTCGDDDALRDEVDRLLDHDAEAARDGFPDASRACRPRRPQPRFDGRGGPSPRDGPNPSDAAQHRDD